MGMLNRATPKDTWGEMTQAAERHYWDGLTLALAEHTQRVGAIYLLGYVAEILLKTAYYQIRRVRSNESVLAELRGMEGRATQLGFPWVGNRHNLRSIAKLLIEERLKIGHAMEPNMAGLLMYHTSRLAGHWSETLRYKNLTASEREMAEVYGSIDWLKKHYDNLWR